MKKIILPVSVTFLLIIIAILSFNSAKKPAKNSEGMVNTLTGSQQDSIKPPSKYAGRFEP